MTISKLVRRRFEKNYSAFCAADKRNLVGRVAILHLIIFAVPISLFMTLVNYAFEEELERYNIDFALLHHISLLFLISVYCIFFDRMIIYALRILDDLKRADLR